MLSRMNDRPTLNDTITGEIRAELARSDISHSAFAKQCGWTPSALSRRMTGEIPWSTDELERIAKELGLPIDHLTNPVRR